MSSQSFSLDDLTPVYDVARGTQYLTLYFYCATNVDFNAFRMTNATDNMLLTTPIAPGTVGFQLNGTLGTTADYPYTFDYFVDAPFFLTQLSFYSSYLVTMQPAGSQVNSATFKIQHIRNNSVIREVYSRAFTTVMGTGFWRMQAADFARVNYELYNIGDILRFTIIWNITAVAPGPAYVQAEVVANRPVPQILLGLQPATTAADIVLQSMRQV